MLRRRHVQAFPKRFETHYRRHGSIQLTPQTAAVVLSSVPGRRGRWLSVKSGYYLGKLDDAIASLATAEPVRDWI